MLDDLKCAARVALILALAGMPLGGCAVISVVDTAADVTGTVVKTGVDVATAPVDLLVGDDEDEKEDD